MAVESRVTQEEIKKEPEKPIDREKVPGLRRPAAPVPPPQPFAGLPGREGGSMAGLAP